MLRWILNSTLTSLAMQALKELLHIFSILKNLFHQLQHAPLWIVIPVVLKNRQFSDGYVILNCPNKFSHDIIYQTIRLRCLQHHIHEKGQQNTFAICFYQVSYSEIYYSFWYHPNQGSALLLKSSILLSEI
jgi:hypothetical protein